MIEIGKKLTVAATRMLLDNLDSFASSDDEKNFNFEKVGLKQLERDFTVTKEFQSEK